MSTLGELLDVVHDVGATKGRRMRREGLSQRYTRVGRFTLSGMSCLAGAMSPPNNR